MGLHWFDSLTRALAAGAERRQALAITAGAFSVLLGRDPTAAGCDKVGKKRHKNKDCCDGARCTGGTRGKCTCKNRFTKCDKRC
jgi:hypothetical protein